LTWKTFGQSILKKMTSVNKELEEFNNENDEGINDLPDFENQMNNNELEEFVEPDIDAKEEDETIMEKMKNFAKKGLLRYTVG
jgi:dsDNA-specific endonuclease/ATPase MutS2